MARVLVAPVLVYLVLLQTRTADVVAAAAFVGAAATDGLDGFLARRYDSVTRTGQWLDPLADKLLVVSPVVALAATGRFPLWAAVIIAAREAIVAALRALLGTRGRAMPASGPAKLKTLLQVLAIALYLLPFGSGAGPAKLTVLVIAVVLTVATGLDYLAKAVGWPGGSPSSPERTVEREQ